MHLAAAPTGVQRAGELQHLLPGTVRQAGARHRGLYQQLKFTRRDRGLPGGETRPFERLPMPGQLRSSPATASPAAESPATAHATGAAAARPCQQLQPCSGPEEEQLVSQERVGEYVIR